MKEKPRIIRLRGHHIAKLASYYLDGIHSTESSSKWFPVKDLEALEVDNALLWSEKIRYNAGVQERERSIYLELIENPDAKIKIANGLDSICLPYCSRKNEDCYSGKGEDFFCLNEYDLKCNEIYDARTIMAKIKKYPEQNGYKWNEPRSRYIEFIKK